MQTLSTVESSCSAWGQPSSWGSPSKTLSKHSNKHPLEHPTISACKGLWVLRAHRETVGGISEEQGAAEHLPPCEILSVRRTDSKWVLVLFNSKQLAGFFQIIMKHFNYLILEWKNMDTESKLPVVQSPITGWRTLLPQVCLVFFPFICSQLVFITAYEQFKAASWILNVLKVWVWPLGHSLA